MASRMYNKYAVINSAGEMHDYDAVDSTALVWRLREFYDVYAAVVVPWKLYWVLREHHSNEWIYEHYKVHGTLDRDIPHPDDLEEVE